MNIKCSAIFDELEARRKLLFDKLELLDQKVFYFTPSRQSWSILQVCHHLIVSEELSLQYLNKKLQHQSSIPAEDFRSSFRSSLLNLSLRLPIRLPAPQRVSEFPENLSWTDLKKRWLNVREGMKDRLHTIPDDYEDKLVYKHPSAGRLTLYQMLLFFKIHIDRHEIVRTFYSR